MRHVRKWVALWTVPVVFSGFSGVLAQLAASLELDLSGGVHTGAYMLASPDSHCLVGSGEAESWDVLLGDDAPAPGGLSIFVLSVLPLSGPAARRTSH